MKPNFQTHLNLRWKVLTHQLRKTAVIAAMSASHRHLHLGSELGGGSRLPELSTNGNEFSNVCKRTDKYHQDRNSPSCARLPS